MWLISLTLSFCNYTSSVCNENHWLYAINSLQTHFSITIYTPSLQKPIASITLSIPINFCNQSLPNTEIQITLNTHPILIESTAQLLPETHYPSHFNPISSNYTIQSLTTQNCNKNYSEQLQITIIHSSNHPQFPHHSSSITINHNAYPSNLLISHPSINTCSKTQSTSLTVIIFQLISALP